MNLQTDECKIQDDGIWISRKVLEECKLHYLDVAFKYHFGEGSVQEAFYTGKADVYTDLLKHFESLEI